MAKIRTSEYRHVWYGMAKTDGHRAAERRMTKADGRYRRGTSDEVVCVLAHAFGFESAGDYGRAMRPFFPASAPEPPEPPDELERWQM